MFKKCCWNVLAGQMFQSIAAGSELPFDAVVIDLLNQFTFIPFHVATSQIRQLHVFVTNALQNCAYSRGLFEESIQIYFFCCNFKKMF